MTTMTEPSLLHRIRSKHARGEQIGFIRIEEGFEYVDASLPTASWFDVYQVEPGDHPIEFYPNRVAITVRATRTQSYRENRLLSASSAHMDDVPVKMSFHIGYYDYQIAKAKIEGTTIFNGALHLNEDVKIETIELPPLSERFK